MEKLMFFVCVLMVSLFAQIGYAANSSPSLDKYIFELKKVPNTMDVTLYDKHRLALEGIDKLRDAALPALRDLISFLGSEKSYLIQVSPSESRNDDGTKANEINELTEKIILSLKEHIEISDLDFILSLIQEDQRSQENKGVLIEKLLGPLGDQAFPIYPKVVEHIQHHPDAIENGYIVSILPKIGKNDPNFLTTFLSLIGDRNIRIWNYNNYDPKKEAIKEILSAEEAKGNLTQFLLGLCKQVKNENEAISSGAYDFLNEVKSHLSVILPQIVEIILNDNEDRNDYVFLSRLLGKSITDFSTIEEILSNAVASHDKKVSQNALWLIKDIGKPFPKLIPKLIEKIYDPKSDDVRSYIADILASMPEAMVPYTEKLLHRALYDKELFCDKRISAVSRCLRQCISTLAPTIMVALNHEDKKIRINALRIIVSFGQEGGAYFLPKLKELFKDPDPIIKILVIEALGSIGPQAQELVPDLKKILIDSSTSNDVEFTDIIAQALVNIDSEDEELFEWLKKNVLESDNFSLRKSSATALTQMSKKVISMVSMLEEMIQGKNLMDRNIALYLLAQAHDTDILTELNKDKTKLIPILIEIAEKDKNVEVKASSIELIKKFELPSEILDYLFNILFSGNEQQKDVSFQIFHRSNQLESLKSRLEEMLKSENIHYRATAAMLLMISKGSKINKQYLPYFIDALSDSTDSIQTVAASGIEQLRERMTPEEKKDLENTLRKALLDHSIFSEEKMSSTVCNLVRATKEWVSDYYKQPEFDMPSDGWGLALLSLGAYFISKAAPYCEEANLMAPILMEELASDKKIQLSPFSEIKEDAHQVLPHFGAPNASPTVYGKQFYILLLRELLKVKSITEKQTEIFRDEMDKAEKSLKGDILVAESHPIGRGGSLFQTHLLATSLLTIPVEEGIELLKSTIISKDPLIVSYLPGEKHNSGTERGDVARAITATYVLYTLEKNVEEKIKYKELLMKTLELGNEHLPSLLMNYFRNDTHLGDDRLAPYYYFANIPYATEAVSVLLNDKNITDAERKKLTEIREWLAVSLLGHVQGDGLFESPGFDTYTSAPGYINPLGGLALLSLMKPKEE